MMEARSPRGKRSVLWIAAAAAAATAGCPRGPDVATDLELRRIVLYRNGVGYFERSGHVEEENIQFRVRREQVGDFLSSLAVVTRRGGSVRGVSFPSLEEPPPPPPPPPCPDPTAGCPPPPPAPPPNPMMDVLIEMDGEEHDVMVAYVVEAPVWRPTYRIVLGDEGDPALLQGWAVVQNISGEDWNDVRLTVTEGAPLTFRADLARPFVPFRPVVTDYGEIVQAPVSATVSIGQAEAQRYAAPAPAAAPYGGGYPGVATGEFGGQYWVDEGFADYNAYAANAVGSRAGYGPARDYAAPTGAYAVTTPMPTPAAAEPPGRVGATQTAQSLALLAARAQEGGLTHYDAADEVTVPDGSSTLIAILNDPVDADDTLLYQPDYAVPDSSQSPFRVVRFTNEVGVTLERGPVAILGRSSFLGQGILEPLPPGATTSIPYALERAVVVTVTTEEDPEEASLVKIVRGRVTVQRFSVVRTTYEARNLGDEDRKMWVRHLRRSGYELATEPEGTEETGEGSALMPLELPAAEASELEVVEKSPVTVEVELFTPLANQAIAAYLEGPAVDAVAAPVLRRVIEASDRLAEMEEERGQLEEKRREIQQMMQEIRADLSVLGTTPRAVELKNRLTADLEQFTRQFQDLTAQIVELNSRAGEMRVELAEAVRALDLTVEQPEGDEGDDEP